MRLAILFCGLMLSFPAAVSAECTCDDCECGELTAERLAFEQSVTKRLTEQLQSQRQEIERLQSRLLAWEEFRPKYEEFKAAVKDAGFVPVSSKSRILPPLYSKPLWWSR